MQLIYTAAPCDVDADVRLPTRLTLEECDVIADVLLDAAQIARAQKAA